MSGATPRKVLVIDDERDLVDAIARRLSVVGGYEVAAAFDGEDGLQKARVFSPDMALVDLAMPELDGWELCRRLRADPRTTGIGLIVMTAWVTDGLERRARDEGVARLLLKPFEDEELLAALRELDASRAGAGEPGGGLP